MFGGEKRRRYSATPGQKKRIRDLQKELDQLSGGEAITYVDPHLPPEVMIEFLEQVAAFERKASPAVN